MPDPKLTPGSGVIWKPGSQYYGKTKQGQYMSEQEALAAGYHEAK